MISIGKEVEIPLTDWEKERIAMKQKYMITKKEACGEPEDTFTVGDTEYTIKFVVKRRLAVVAHYYWKEEGAHTPEEFIRNWEEQYGEYNPKDTVYQHTFVENLKDE